MNLSQLSRDVLNPKEALFGLKIDRMISPDAETMTGTVISSKKHCIVPRLLPHHQPIFTVQEQRPPSRQETGEREKSPIAAGTISQICDSNGRRSNFFVCPLERESEVNPTLSGRSQKVED